MNNIPNPKNFIIDFKQDGNLINEENEYYESGNMKTNIIRYKEGKTFETKTEQKYLESCCPPVYGMRKEIFKYYKIIINFNEKDNTRDTTYYQTIN